MPEGDAAAEKKPDAVTTATGDAAKVETKAPDVVAPVVDPDKVLADPPALVLKADGVKAEYLTAFTAEAAALGLTQAQAQALLDKQITAARAEVAARPGRHASERAAAEAAETARRAAVEAATKADPEIGGPKWADTEVSLTAGFTAFDPNGAAKAKLAAAGLLYDADVVRAFANAGAATRGDRIVRGNDGTIPAAPPSLGEALQANTYTSRKG